MNLEHNLKMRCDISSSYIEHLNVYRILRSALYEYIYINHMYNFILVYAVSIEKFVFFQINKYEIYL